MNLRLSNQPPADSLMAAGGQAGFSKLVGQIVVSSQFRNRSTQEETPASAPNHRADASQPKSNFNTVGGQ